MRVPDNFDLWEAHDIEQERRRARLPQCEDCQEPIQDDDYYDVDGDILCEECMKDRYRKFTEDYIEI